MPLSVSNPGHGAAQEELAASVETGEEILNMQIVSSSRNEGMTTQEAEAYAKLKWFCSSLMKKLAPPLLKEVQASSLRPEAEPFTPRRSTRGSKRPAANRSTNVSKAENVLMRALGLVPDDLEVDEGLVSELREMFDSLRQWSIQSFSLFLWI